MKFEKFENIPTNILCAYVLEQTFTDQMNFLYEIHQNDNDTIYRMEDFEDIIKLAVDVNGIHWLANRIYYGNFNPFDDFWCFDGYGNLESFTLFECENRLRMLIEDAFGYMAHNEIAKVFNYLDWEEEDVIGDINDDVNGVYAELAAKYI